MTPIQTLAVRAGELRSRLGELGGMAELSEENQKELDNLRSEYMDNERKQGALTIAGDVIPEPIETRDDAQGREIRRLLARANLGTMLENIMEQRSHDGAEKEVNDHYGLGYRQIPITMLRDWAQPLETRARTEAPANVQGNQDEVLDYVFPMAMASFLNVDMPTVPVGAKIYPVMSTSPTIAVPAEGVTVPDTTGIFLAESLSPGRLQAAYTFSREDKATFPMMEETLRESLSMGISDGLDAQVIAGINGLLGTSGLTLRTGDAGAEATFATYRGLLFDSETIDGRYASMPADIRMVMGPAAFNHAGGIYRTANSDISALENLISNSGGVRASAHVPAPSTNDQDVIVRKGMRRAMVAPLWMGLDIIYDELTQAATGEIVLTAVALFSVKIIRADDFQRRAVQVA